MKWFPDLTLSWSISKIVCLKLLKNSNNFVDFTCCTKCSTLLQSWNKAMQNIMVVFLARCTKLAQRIFAAICRYVSYDAGARLPWSTSWKCEEAHHSRCYRPTTPENELGEVHWICQCSGKTVVEKGYAQSMPFRCWHWNQRERCKKPTLYPSFIFCMML